LITLHALYHPPSSLFHLHYNQFNPTCFRSHRKSHLPANKPISRSCCQPHWCWRLSQRLAAGLARRHYFRRTIPPSQGFASWATSAGRSPPSTLQHQEPKHALLQNPSTPRRRHLLGQPYFATFWIGIRVNLDTVTSVGIRNAACTIYSYQQLQRVHAPRHAILTLSLLTSAF
jgi:hypothetical protein